MAYSTDLLTAADYLLICLEIAHCLALKLTNACLTRTWSTLAYSMSVEVTVTCLMRVDRKTSQMRSSLKLFRW